MESGIPQGSPVSPILFLIYISGVFSIIEEQLPHVTCVSFIDDLGFLTADRSISKIAKTLEKVGRIALEKRFHEATTVHSAKPAQLAVVTFILEAAPIPSYLS